MRTFTRTLLRFLPVLTAIMFLPVIPAGSVLAQNPPEQITFPEAPARHMSVICLPDDWHKPLVTQDGALAYDFGPGPYARPLTELVFGLEGGPPGEIRQFYDDARVPIPRTICTAGADTLRMEAFAIIPPGDTLPPMGPGIHPVYRINGLNGTRHWAQPPAGTDPAFRPAAWGTNRPIRYRLAVSPGSRKRIALGLCESYKPRPRTRLLSLQVEGASHRTVDPMAAAIKNTPSVFFFDGEDSDGDGTLKIEVHADAESPDPNVFLNCFWIFPAGSRVTPDEVITGRARAQSELVWECGREVEKWAPMERMEALRAAVSGSTPPVLRIFTRRHLQFIQPEGMVLADSIPFCFTSPPAAFASRTGDTLILHWPAGTRTVDAIVLGGSVRQERVRQFPDLATERARVIRYWNSPAPIPPARIIVPDPRLQYLIDANIRNLFQVRDIVDGGVQFQPGPTVYRGLWLQDVFISGSVALMLGDTGGVRRALEHGMEFQGGSGQFLVLRPSTALNETPIFLTMMCRFAAFTGDDLWLRKHWSVLQNGIRWIRHISMHTYDDESFPYAGLMPPGFVDGGIAHKTADYGTVWWVLIALEHAADAAERLGFTQDAQQWRKYHEDFQAPLRRAIVRDLKNDERGNLYLPITIGDTTRGIPPQRGQYAFLLPFPYGGTFFRADTLLQRAISGTMAMLDASTSKGMIVGSGWMHDGVWSWLAGIHSMAHHYRGDYTSAWTYLQAYADHATPLGTWVEEHQQRSVGTRTAGDASNAEASAIFLQTVRTFLLRERGDTLHILAGYPASWVFPGSHAQLLGGGSPLGGVSLDVRVSAGADSVVLQVSRGKSTAAEYERQGRVKPVLLHLETFRRLGFAGPGEGTVPDRLINMDSPAVLTLVRKR
ncbi:MAG TPA: hypothetical protein VLT13_15740 [Bacteroidota bacterium]|nr:hypothetical protein [Bacteroidota bacterium]